MSVNFSHPSAARYRVATAALAAAGATVVNIDGIPITGNTWSLTSAAV